MLFLGLNRCRMVRAERARKYCQSPHAESGGLRATLPLTEPGGKIARSLIAVSGGVGAKAGFMNG
jgi:hypothetical protein